MTSVNRFRLTTIWPVLLTTLLEGPDVGSGALQAFSGLHSYRSFFEEAKLDQSHRPGVPWGDSVEHKFWLEYSTRARDAVPNDLTGRMAQRFVVPLHEPTGAPRCEPWKLSAHTFLYPFGAAVVLHAEYPHPDSRRETASSPGVEMDKLVEACYDLRAGGSEAHDIAPWTGFVDETLSALLPLFGAGQDDVGKGEGITIATFLEVSGAESLEVTLRDRVLNALTSWPEHGIWRDSTALPGPEVALGDARARTGRLIHAATRGRAIWFPDGFVSGGGLSEMHRRLYFVTMQTEMLIRFLEATAIRLPNLPVAWADWANPAARVAGLLYGGKITAADSTSPKVQIDSLGATPAINLVRESFGDMEPLS